MESTVRKLRSLAVDIDEVADNSSVKNHMILHDLATEVRKLANEVQTKTTDLYKETWDYKFEQLGSLIKGLWYKLTKRKKVNYDDF